MTDGRRPQVMILCEDKAHLDLIKGYCQAAGWNPRSIISADVSPEARGSAEQWVRERYERTLRSFRSWHRQGRNIILLVMIDADNRAVAERKRTVERDVQRQAKEPVAIFVPKRNIESWMAYLDGNLQTEDETGEEENYKNQYERGVSRRRFGEALRERCRSATEAEFPPSLGDACQEWRERVSL